MASTEYKCVVPVSGGKDSQTCLKLAIHEFGVERVMGVFFDTQFEHPWTYDHIQVMRELYDVRIDRITAGTVPEKVLKYSRFPGAGGARHCTEELKLVPGKKFYKHLATDQGTGFEVWIGVRTEESKQRSKRYAGTIGTELYDLHEVMPSKFPKYLAKLGVRARFPIVDWTEGDVFDALDGQSNPLYAAGFPRVGCFPCLAAGDKYKKQCFEFDAFGAKQYHTVQIISAQIQQPIFKNSSTEVGCAFCAE